MGGPGSGRRKGGSISNVKGQAAAANRVAGKRKKRGATDANIKEWKKGLVKRSPALKGKI